MAKESRREIAKRIAELSGEELRVEPTQKYWALKPKSGKNIVAAVVSDTDRVQFIIPSQVLRDRAKEEGFTLSPARGGMAMHEQKFYFRGLSLNDLRIRETLFRDVVMGSVEAIRDRKSGKM
jgi:hypothetical protein